VTPHDPAWHIQRHDPKRNARVVGIERPSVLVRAANIAAGIAFGAVPLAVAVWWGWL
jgi:hypothetical protein